MARSSPVPQYLPGFAPSIEPSVALVEEWTATKYVPRKRAEGGRDASLVTTQGDIRLFARFFRSTYHREPAFVDLNDAVAEDFFVWHTLQPHCKSTSTANRSRASLLSVWRDAARRGMCYPPLNIRLVRVDRASPRAWSMDELGRLLAASRDGVWDWYRPRRGVTSAAWQTPSVDASVWLFAVIITIYYTGLRISALLKTPTPRLDLPGKGLLVPAGVQKQRVEQFFPMPDEAVEAWQRLDVHGRKVARLGDDWPYDRHENSRWKTLNRWLARLLREARLVAEGDNVRRELWHKLRRTFATHLAAKHGIEAARRWLGHSSIEVTLRYIDPRFVADIDPSKSLPRPTIPEAEVVSLALFKQG